MGTLRYVKSETSYTTCVTQVKIMKLVNTFYPNYPFLGLTCTGEEVGRRFPSKFKGNATIIYF